MNSEVQSGAVGNPVRHFPRRDLVIVLAFVVTTGALAFLLSIGGSKYLLPSASNGSASLNALGPTSATPPSASGNPTTSGNTTSSPNATSTPGIISCGPACYKSSP